MIKELRKTINNPIDFKNFYVLFVIAYLLIFIPLLAIARLTAFKTTCNNTNLRFAQQIPSEMGKTIEFMFEGERNCKIMLSPLSPNKNLSWWLYKPDRSILPINSESLGPSKVYYGEDKGLYRVSVHNKGKSTTSLNLQVTSVPK